ncbi:hypothetical protein GCM10010430_51970 [Kitasatospora cystarginea]|uniref:Uncharacterized protein n=1 Tax=Kitasatospora cystarginea TaxID=58350 RepID=A0ABP5RGR8_9ACTN
MQLLDELGHILRTLAQREGGVQFTEDLFGGGQRHAAHPVIAPIGPPPVFGPLSVAALCVSAPSGPEEEALASDRAPNQVGPCASWRFSKAAGRMTV